MWGKNRLWKAICGGATHVGSLHPGKGSFEPPAFWHKEDYLPAVRRFFAGDILQFNDVDSFGLDMLSEVCCKKKFVLKHTYQ